MIAAVAISWCWCRRSLGLMIDEYAIGEASDRAARMRQSSNTITSHPSTLVLTYVVQSGITDRFFGFRRIAYTHRQISKFFSLTPLVQTRKASISLADYRPQCYGGKA